MSQWLWLVALAASLLTAAPPTRFYIVSVSFSDYGATDSYRIVDVQPEAGGSFVRTIRVAPSDIYCRRILVRAAERHIPGQTPAQLAAPDQFCAAGQPAGKPRRDNGFETDDFAVVADCGKPAPTVQQLRTVRTPIFGANDPLHSVNDQQDFELQQSGDKLVELLRSGRYDQGLSAAARSRQWKSPSFRDLLAVYRGPVRASEIKAAWQASLRNADVYRFTHLILPSVPPLAQQARIQGTVELQLTVSASTGEITEAKPQSGHPLLQQAAVAAAKQWRLEPGTAPAREATLDFSLRCP